MQALRKYALAVVAVFIPSLAVAEEEKAPRWTGWEFHLRVGTQTYLNELDPDPDSAGLAGVSHRIPPVGLVHDRSLVRHGRLRRDDRGEEGQLFAARYCQMLWMKVVCPWRDGAAEESVSGATVADF